MNAHASTDSGPHAATDARRAHCAAPAACCALRRQARARGFTIVELLTVVGIIALLMAIAFPALRGVQVRTRKTVESNNIRQVYFAWTMYSNHNRDAALPGYLDPEVQEAWRVKYEYPIPPNPSKPGDRYVPPEIAAPWTWRLFHYMDHNLETLWRYRDVPSTSWTGLVALAGDQAGVDALMTEVAEEPAFGYNAYHLGGWWQMEPIPGGGSGKMPLPKFFNAEAVNGGHSVEVVSRSIATIRRPADLIVFCTSSKFRTSGTHRVRDDQISGAHAIMPPFLADEQRWTSPPSLPGYEGKTNLIQTYAANTYAPLGRYNSMPTLVHVDGSIEATIPVNLFDMRKWIDNPLGMDVASGQPYAPWFTD